eukprot:1119809-Pelagomonas_calceolata.AAC.7
MKKVTKGSVVIKMWDLGGQVSCKEDVYSKTKLCLRVLGSGSVLAVGLTLCLIRFATYITLHAHPVTLLQP